MSRLFRHLAWLADAQDPVVDAMLLQDDENESAVIHRQADVPPHAEVTLTNPGWAKYAPGSYRAAAILESDDATLSTARVIARGWLRDLPDNLGKSAVTITLECYGTVEQLRLAKNAAARAYDLANPPPPDEYSEDGALYGDTTATLIPDQDWLMGRLEADRDQVVVGRTVDWHFDPVSHGISLHDYTVPMGTVRDIAEDFDPGTLSRSVSKGCPKRIRMKLICNFSPTFSGICNVAPAIFQSVSSMTGYSYNLAQRPGLSAGWTLQTPVVQTGQSVSVPFGTVAYDMNRRLVFETFNTATNTWDRTYSGISWGRHRFMVELYRYQYFFMSWVANWTYSQARREVVNLTLDVPTQDVTGLVDELELEDRSLQPVFTIPVFLLEDRDGDEDAPEPSQPYDPSKVYDTGDTMTLQGREYRALADGITGQPWIVQIVGNGATVTVDPRWQPTNRRAAFPTPVHSIFDQARGKAAIAAAFRLMRKEALKLVYDEISVTVDRAEYPEWSLGDTLNLLLPGRHDEPQKPASGRVIGIVETLGSKGDTVQLTIRVGKGMGGDAIARPARINGFGGSDYFNGSYLDYEETAWNTAGDDIEWTLESDPLYLPVDPARLGQSSYAVQNVSVTGSAAQHEAKVRALNEAGRNVTGIGAELAPTVVSIQMRSIPNERTAVRKFRATGTLLRTPRGITL